ncbi:FAD-dependent oxidoreductase [Legionella gratiana]|uniref:FAD-dependent oxidoreductase n=1 Tax=Legionella gratiana TaxID=45066 RepID=UPI00138F90A4|nr:FAD-dependent oxidoreductase [Legionella gratiana]
MLFNQNIFAVAINTEAVLLSPAAIQVPQGTKLTNISFTTTDIDDFSVLLGTTPLPELTRKASLSFYEPELESKGVIVISPGSEGVRDQMIGQHIRHFLQMGVAVLVVDSYKIRGVSHVLSDQAAISLPSQVLDIALAIKKIHQMKDYCHLPVGLFGTSRGGLAVTLVLDERLFHALRIPHILKYAMVLYPAMILSYDPQHIRPLMIPVLDVIAGKDDEVSPQQAIDFGLLMQNKNPQFKLKIWPEAGHLFDAPFPKTWIPNGDSMAKSVLITIDPEGHFIYRNHQFKNWSEVVAFEKKFITKGIHIGYTNNSNKKIFKLMNAFVERSLSNSSISTASNTTRLLKADVAVVGAGYSGLLAARTLARAGYRVIILEARDRVGGRAYSKQLLPGVTADLGAGWIISPTHKHMIQLAKEYHVQLYPTYIKGDALIMESDNTVHRVPMSELSFSPEKPPLSLKPAAQLLQRLITMSQSLDAKHPWTYPDAERLDSMTFLEWFRTNYPKMDAKNVHIVARTIEGYIGPMYATSLLNVLAYVKMSHGLNHYADMRYWLRVEGGVAAIAEKIAQELKQNQNVSLLFNHQVYRIDQAENGVRVHAKNTTIEATHIVVAIPPIAVNGIHFYQAGDKIVPQAGTMDMNQRIPMTPGFKAMFVYNKPFWRARGLSGHVVTSSEPIGVVWDASPKDAQVGCLILLNIPFGRPVNLADMSQKERKQVLKDSLVKFFGDDARNPIDYAEQMWDASSFSLGSVGVPSLGSWTSFGQYLRLPTGRIHWTSSERALESWAQMDGAVESGLRVGNEVINDLQQ